MYSVKSKMSNLVTNLLSCNVLLLNSRVMMKPGNKVLHVENGFIIFADYVTVMP